MTAEKELKIAQKNRQKERSDLEPCCKYRIRHQKLYIKCEREESFLSTARSMSSAAPHPATGSQDDEQDTRRYAQKPISYQGISLQLPCQT
jgi:hypothetical protein